MVMMVTTDNKHIKSPNRYYSSRYWKNQENATSFYIFYRIAMWGYDSLATTDRTGLPVGSII